MDGGTLSHIPGVCPAVPPSLALSSYRKRQGKLDADPLSTVESSSDTQKLTNRKAKARVPRDPGLLRRLQGHIGTKPQGAGLKPEDSSPNSYLCGFG